MLVKPSSSVGWAVTVASVFLLAFGGQQGRPIFAEANGCSSKTKENQCSGGCVWEDGACYDAGTEPSAGGTPVTSSPTVAPADAEGQVCAVTWNSGADKFQKTNDKDLTCPTGYTCEVANDTGNNDEVLYGICISESCAGKAEPGGPDDNESTTRVTICHRTCSETNPWVRITIDDDAWGNVDANGDGLIDGNGASGCGHQRNHDIRDECSNKAPWLRWGGQYKDYIIKVHGTKEEVTLWNGFDKNEEKAYWQKWERACPYVRSTKANNPCCDWASGECCGEPPGLLPPDEGDYTCAFPSGMTDHSVVVEKDCSFSGGSVAGDVSCGGTLSASGSLTVDGYVESRLRFVTDSVTLNGGSTLLANGLDQYSTEFYHTDATDLTIDYFNFAWIAEYGVSGTQGDYEMIVVTSGGVVSDDTFGISSCSEGDKVLVVFDTTDIVTIVPGSNGNCFGGSIIAPKSLVYIGESAAVPMTIDGLVVAKSLEVVSGSVTFNKNPYAGPLICDEASPAPSPGPSPVPTETPDDSILLVKKVVKTSDGCPDATAEEMAAMIENELVIEQPGSDVTYCYYFKNTGDRKMCSINLKDPDLDFDEFTSAPGVNGCLLPGEEGTYELDTILPPNSDDEDATITGQPVDESDSDVGSPVSASDGAAVVPISISLEKTYTTDLGGCSSSNAGVDVLTVDAGVEVQVCYLVTNPVPPGDSGSVSPVCSLKITDSSGLYNGNAAISVTEGGDMVNGCLPPDGSVYVDGPTFTSTVSEGDTDATVTGKPEGAGTPKVTDSDPAAIVVDVDRNICPIDMSVTGDTVCPGATGIVVLEQSYPADAPAVGTDLLYDLSFGGTSEGPSVSFKVMNPFDEPADMYVQYDGEVDGTAGTFLETCDKRLNVPGCDEGAPTVTVACLAPDRLGVTPFAKVWVHFSTSEELGSGTAEVKECCEPESDIGSSDVVKYLFVIECECPVATA